MAYKIPWQGGPVSFNISWASPLPEGTTFSALAEPNNTQGIFSSMEVNEDGSVLTITPSGQMTGNVYISVIATVPAGQDVYATRLVHVTDNPDETTNYGDLEPQ